MSTSYASSLRDRSLPRKPQEMSRSGSFLGTIKSFVATPLSWLGSMGKAEEPTKRRREATRASSDDEREEVVEQRSKRMRIGSPDDETTRSRSTAGYLDPHLGTFPASRRRLNLASTVPPPVREDRVLDTREFGYAPSAGSARMMSVDPPSRHTSLREGSIVPLPEPSPIRSSFSLGPREGSVQRPYQPLKLRSSLTPQPSVARPVRREASAPPPLSSLQSRPKFVRAPPNDLSSRESSAQKTVSLGALADMMGRRTSRSPTRDRTPSILGSTISFESSILIEGLDAYQLSSQSTAEKTLQGLEMYKTPILPSRHKQAKVYPEFLRPKRSHVPIPMPKKGRDLLDSEGQKRKERVRDAGKPYAGRSGLSKFLRQAEEEKERTAVKEVKNYRTDEDGDAEMESLRGSSKRDVGVGTQFAEDESRARKQEAIMKVGAGIAPIEALTDPHADPSRSRSLGGRDQPYGRVGRLRVREVGQRAVPLARRPGKFSAIAEDAPEEDTTDSQAMDTASDTGRSIESVLTAAMNKEQGSAKAVFKAPEGFTFAATMSIQHDTSNAKEPPLPSLPFSLGMPATQPDEELDIKPIIPAPAPAATVSGKPSAPQAPSVSFAIPTSAQPTACAPEAPKNFFTSTPVVKEEKTPSTPSAGGIPNFFADSPFLANKTPTTAAVESTTPKTTPPKFEFSSNTAAAPSFVTSVKDSDTPKSTPPASVVPKPLFGTAVSTSSKVAGDGGVGSPSPLFGASVKAPGTSSEAAPTPSPFFGGQVPGTNGPSTNAPATSPFTFGAQTTSAKAPEAEAKPSPSSSPFSFPSATSASTPKPLFGGQPASTASTIQAPSNTEQKPAAFSFGAPPVASVPSDSSAAPTTLAPKPVFGGTNSFPFGTPSGSPVPTGAESSKPSTPFAFGAHPATPPITGESKSPFFGAPAPAAPGSSSGGAFAFGAVSKPGDAPTPAATPTTSTHFSFGAAPARPATPPSKPDEGMSMEASPTRMDSNGSEAAKPAGTISFGFGATPVNPFAQSNGSNSGFTFGSSTNASNLFAKEAPKVDTNALNFSRTASAPAISTAFSFGQKADINTPPATAVGSSANPFTQPPTSSGSASGAAPFTFGQPSSSTTNPFGISAQPAAPANATPSSPYPTTNTFPFGASSTSGSNAFGFGSSQPSSPAVQAGGLPSSPVVANSSGPSFTFGQAAGSSGSSLFNIGAPPSASPGGTPGRAMKKLPRRAPPRR